MVNVGKVQASCRPAPACAIQIDDVRLTDFPRGSADDFAQLIGAATASRRTRTARDRSAVVANAEWADFSRQVAGALPAPVDWHLSPGYLMDRGRRADTDREFLYFNLHGFSGVAEWKGYDTVQQRFVTAVTPDAFDQQYVSGSVVFAENCYGAQTRSRTASQKRPRGVCAIRVAIPADERARV